ncbi:Hint domain-containing protein [Mameliella alba]|nr:Hint domain-containing protein [Mameliella alba]MBY6170218.1 Hint domain-containing protein [Mameliella alba]MBY6175237.1 Hint domain-containing protein [Mameliella alba]
MERSAFRAGDRIFDQDVVDTTTISDVQQPAPVSGLLGRTRVKTLRGEVPVQDLRPGDRVLTRDNGYQVLRWTGLIRPGSAMAPIGPVRIRKGALGRNAPDRALRVAPGQRLLLGGAQVRALTGQPEVLACAQHLCALPGIARPTGQAASFVQLLFDRHEVLMTDGAWSESLRPRSGNGPGLMPQARPMIARRLLKTLLGNAGHSRH